MKILADECVGGAVVDYLREKGHDVLWIQEEASMRGASDKEVFELAKEENCLLFTLNYRDFQDTSRFPPDECEGLIVLTGFKYPSSRRVIERLEEYPELLGDEPLIPKTTVLVKENKLEVVT